MDRLHGDTPYRLDCLPNGPLQANCYFLTCITTRQTMLVDPGSEPERILAHVRQLGTDVALIVHTHGHFDHIAATERVLAGLPRRVPIAAHMADAYLYEPAARQKGAEFGYDVPDSLETPDVTLVDGARVTVGELRLRVIHTPGHTPGSICLAHGDTFVLSGDTLFRRGIGRTDLPGGDEDAIYESIATRLYPLPLAMEVYPGHGPATTIDEERRGNPFVQAEGP